MSTPLVSVKGAALKWRSSKVQPKTLYGLDLHKPLRRAVDTIKWHRQLDNKLEKLKLDVIMRLKELS